MVEVESDEGRHIEFAGICGSRNQGRWQENVGVIRGPYAWLLSVTCTISG
jgi:hypothetical protein